MAKHPDQIQYRKELEDQLVEAAIDVSNAKNALDKAESRLERIKKNLANLNEIENRDQGED